MLQKEIIEIFLPIIEEAGKDYRKNKNIFARKAKIGEEIITNTSDGEETRNTAKEESYIIKNQTGAEEQYIISAPKFRSRYEYLKENKDGWSEYQSTGKIRAIELSAGLLERLKLKTPFYFMASWGEKMIAKENDFLAVPYLEKKEIYRLARKEFFETYVLSEG